jgi:hypothetical protein
MDLNPIVIFFIQFGFEFTILALMTNWYVMPWFRSRPLNEALSLILVGGALRYMGTVLLVQQVVPHPPDYLGAYGDLVVATIAIAGMVANHSNSSLGKPLAWAYVIIGGTDMMITAVRGFLSGLFTDLGGGYTLIMIFFPPIVLSLIVNIILLVKPHATPALAKR